MMRLRNLVLGLIDQLVVENGFDTFLVSRSAWGIFHRNSHINRFGGKEKVFHPTKLRARLAAAAMQAKEGIQFDAYKCIFCDGYHIGRSRL